MRYHKQGVPCCKDTKFMEYAPLEHSKMRGADYTKNYNFKEL